MASSTTSTIAVQKYCNDGPNYYVRTISCSSLPGGAVFEADSEGGVSKRQ